METDDQGPPNPMLQQLIGTYINMRNADGEPDLDSEDEEEVLGVESAILELGDRLKAVQSEYGSYPTNGEWNADEPCVKIKKCLYELAGIMHSEASRFNKQYMTTYDAAGKAGRRLLRTRKFLTSHLTTAMNMIVTIALLPGMDVSLSCLALKVLQLMWSSILDPDNPLVSDPLGLGTLRITLDEVSGFNSDRVVALATNTAPLTGAAAMQRALATSLLRHCVRDVDTCYKLIEDPDHMKALLWRLRGYYFGAAKPSPRRGAKKAALRQNTTQTHMTTSSTTSASVSAPAVQPAPSRSATAPTTSQDRIVLPIRRNTAAVAHGASEAPASAPTDNRRSRSQVDDTDAAPLPSGRPARRRSGLASRLRQVTEVVQDGTLFPKGCDSSAPPPQSLREVDTLGILHLLSGVASYHEVLAPALQTDTLDVLMLLIDRTHRAVYPEELVMAAYNSLSGLLVQKRFAYQFVDANGVEQVVNDSLATLEHQSTEAALLQAQCYTIQQVSKGVSILERFTAAHQSTAPRVVQCCVKMLRHPMKEHRQEAAKILADVLSVPIFLHAFDEKPEAILALINAADAESREIRQSETSGLEAALCHAFATYVKAHLVLATASLWPASPKLGKALCRAVHKALPLSQFENIFNFLSQPLTTVQSKPNGPDKKVRIETRPPGAATGLSLLTKTRLSAVSRLEENDLLRILLKMLGQSIRHPYQTEAMVIEPVLSLLEILCCVPFLHSSVVTCYLEDTASRCGLGLLLEAATEEFDYNDEKNPQLLNLKALNCIRMLVTPATFDDRTCSNYNEIWQLFRINNGVKTVLEALGHKSTQYGDMTRHVAARILLNMCALPSLRNVLEKMDVPKLLVGILHEGPAGEATEAYFEHFKQTAQLVVASVTSGGQDHWDLPDMDHALKRLEKSAIVQNTDIDFSQGEMLQVIQSYLQQVGMRRSAELLKKEAKLANQLQTQQQKGLRPLHDLSDIVKGFLRKQHMECQNPISTLPTFSLRKGTQPALRAAAAGDSRNESSNVAVRLRQRALGHKTKMHACHDRRLKHNHVKTMLLTRGHSQSRLLSVAFSNDGEEMFIGLSSGGVVRYNVLDPNEGYENEIQINETGEDITGLRMSALSDLSAVWTDNVVTVHKLGGETRIAEEAMITQPSYRAGVFGNEDPNMMVLTSSGETKCSVFDLTSNQVVQEYMDKDRSLDNDYNLAVTNAYDNVLLSDSILYDLRTSPASNPIYRYDKFCENSRGIFSTTQNEVVIDKEVCTPPPHPIPSAPHCTP